MRASGMSQTTAFVVATLWEVAEPSLKSKYPKAFPHPEKDTPSNKVVEIAAVMLGWSLFDAMEKP